MKEEMNPLIHQRWSPRLFSSEAVTREEIRQLIEAARWAASARNSQPWRFIIGLKQAPEIWGKLFECLTEPNQQWAQTAPVLLLTLVKKNNEELNIPLRYGWHDLGLAMGNLTNQAMSMGLYVHNMGGFSPEKAVDLFNIPDEFDPVTIVAVGRIDASVEAPARQRRTFDQLVFENDWNKLF